MNKLAIDASGAAVLALVIGFAAWNPFEQRVGPQPPVVTLELEAGTLYQYFRAVARQDPQPEIHLVPARDARYEMVASTLDAAHRIGVTKLAFADAGIPPSPPPN